MGPERGWSREAFESGATRLLSRGSRLKPAVFAWDDAPEPVIVKDVRPLARAGRPLARWLLRRERRILERLAGIEGVPQLRGRLDRDAIACSRLEGAPLDRGRFQAEPRALASQLRRRVADLHARGVFHLDLKQRQNLLVDERGRLALVDFGAAWDPGPLGRLFLGRLLRWVDRQAVLKYLARYAPAQMTDEEARELLRGRLWRRLWFVSSHRSRGEWEAARERLGKGPAGDPADRNSDDH